MRNMGALWKKLPITYAVMLIGTLAITGIGLPGVELGFAGFYSKDAIINSAYAASGQSGAAAFGFWISLIAAGLTSFYSWRLVFMTFHGTAKWGQDAHAHDPDALTHGAHADLEPAAHHGHGHGHEPHESPWVMLVPLLVLALGAVAAGYGFHEHFVGGERGEFWRASIFAAPLNHVLDFEGHLPAWVIWAPLTVTAIGFAAAFWAYILNEGLGARIAARRGLLWSFLYNKWYFDEIYEFIFVRSAKGLGDLFWKGGDQRLIDGLGPDGIAAVSAAVGKRVGRLQTGYVYHYAFVMLVGVAGLLGYALYTWHS
jgi:NADH-quinone oxidoreductase subunit L